MNTILSIILFLAGVAIYMLAKKFKAVLKENKNLTAKNDELRTFLSTMNSELDSKDAELTELAVDPNSLVGVKYRTQAEIQKNMQLQAMRIGEEQ